MPKEIYCLVSIIRFLVVAVQYIDGKVPSISKGTGGQIGWTCNSTGPQNRFL
jgi:hypothetical protein